MKDFNKGGFKKSFGDRGGDRGSFRGKPSFSGDRGGDRPSFGKKPWDKGPRDFGGDKEMFSATCASCGKPCQVPFKPVDGRPVYCNDCFRTDRDEGGRSNDRSFSPAPRQDFARREERSFDRPKAAAPAANDYRIDGIVKQLEKVSSQMDQLVNLMKQSHQPAPVATKSVEKTEVVAKKAVKVAKVAKVIKKVAKKK